MKITKVRAHVLEARLSQPFAYSRARYTTRTTMVVEIETDVGLVGWGECYGPARINAAVVESLSTLLIGQDPMRGEWIWREIYSRYRDHGQKGSIIQGLSGIDIALWDLKGKFLGQPIHRLMGGPLRSEVRAYATGLYRRDEGRPDVYLAEEAAGYANHAYDAVSAIQLGRKIEGLDIGWFEEPVPPEDVASHRKVREALTIPIASGECEFTRFGFRNLITTHAVDIVQPDTCSAGGLSECKKIADFAETYNLRYAPHVWGSGIALAAALQLLAVIPSFTPQSLNPVEPMLEFDRTEHPIRQALLLAPIEHRNGIVQVPDGPGLGIEIDRTVLKRFAKAV
jgi:D-galactarolactone cycloisomerase